MGEAQQPLSLDRNATILPIPYLATIPQNGTEAIFYHLAIDGVHRSI
jgi:hypothetical protein